MDLVEYLVTGAFVRSPFCAPCTSFQALFVVLRGDYFLPCELLGSFGVRGDVYSELQGKAVLFLEIVVAGRFHITLYDKLAHHVPSESALVDIFDHVCIWESLLTFFVNPHKGFKDPCRTVCVFESFAEPVEGTEPLVFTPSSHRIFVLNRLTL